MNRPGRDIDICFEMAERTQSMERLLADLRLTRASDFHLSLLKIVSISDHRQQRKWVQTSD